MTASYPTEVPDYTGQIGADDDPLSQPELNDWAQNISDDVAALAEELGVNASGASSNVSSRIATIESDLSDAESSLTTAEADIVTALDNAAAAQATANAAMPKTGGTFTGPVELANNGAASMQPITLQQLNEHIASGTHGGGGGDGGVVNEVTGTAPIEVDATDPTAPDVSVATVTQVSRGVMSAADKTKLDGIEGSATADQTPAEILTAVKTVDGAGSGLDADTLDGNEATDFESAGTVAAHEADTTDIHGIADTSQLETTSGAQSKADTAESNAEATAIDADADHVAEVMPHRAVYPIVQTAPGAAIEARPVEADVPNGYVEWNLFDEPDGSEGMLSLDKIFNISGTAW